MLRAQEEQYRLEQAQLQQAMAASRGGLGCSGAPAFQASGAMPPSLLQAYKPARPPFDLSRHVILRGSKSQYTDGGGQSACTAICIAAAARVLHHLGAVTAPLPGGGLVDAWRAAGREKIDDWIALGSAAHAQVPYEHSGLEDLWPTDALRPFTGALSHGLVKQYANCRKTDFEAALVAAEDLAQPRAFKSPAGGFALLITKPPETIVCFVLPASTSLEGGDVSYIYFDSHPRGDKGVTVGHVCRFQSRGALAEALAEVFPSVDLGDEFGMQGAMMNQFDAYVMFPDGNSTPPMGGITQKQQAQQAASATMPPAPPPPPRRRPRARRRPRQRRPRSR